MPDADGREVFDHSPAREFTVPLSIAERSVPCRIDRWSARRGSRPRLAAEVSTSSLDDSRRLFDADIEAPPLPNPRGLDGEDVLLAELINES